ncbi:MSMEG_6728 family protein [Streptomyces sp. NPDC057411]|uniref:MSMEG_6728 family protein n=1 Tax=unclassified Streptomyces TaxID=2593676 RepID=UPI003635709B
MQTFLPYPGFADSAAVLDQRRLGKQRVEALQVFRGLTVAGYGWRRHPAVRMWAGYEEALVRYGLDICQVWTAEGRADTCATTMMTDYLAWRPRGTIRVQSELAASGELPPWLGDPAFHRSHQSALLRKAPEFYRHHFPHVPDDLPYLWPPSDRDDGEDHGDDTRPRA